jgi:CheY-like chemotaxis protein
VEDNPGDVRLAQEAFAEAGTPVHISAVPDGIEALAFLRQQGDYAGAPVPDLILLDLNMPRMDGRQTLAEIKLDPELRVIPVLVLTTSQAESDIAQCYDLHANCYIAKPVDLDQFLDIVQSIERFWLGTALLPPKRGV